MGRLDELRDAVAARQREESHGAGGGGGTEEGTAGARRPAYGLMTLEPGDIVATGTPAGVGSIRKPRV